MTSPIRPIGLLISAVIALLTAGMAAAQMQPVRVAHAAPNSVPPISRLQTMSPLPGARRLARPYGGTAIDVTTYHYDDNRTGWNPTETDLTPASVASANFGVLAVLPVDGNVLAQPLVVTRFAMPSAGLHDVLIIATGHNSVYAFDAQTYDVLWHVNLGPSQNSNDVGCPDVQPEYGISSTPVIVRTGSGAATIYLVTATEPAPGQFETQLHALDLGTGRDIVAPTEIWPGAVLTNGANLIFGPRNQWVRAGLAYGASSIYVSIGSHCDSLPYNVSGWELRFDAATLAMKNSFHTIVTPHGYQMAGIWMSGFAPAIDAQGNLYVVTGNGDYHGAREDYGESILRLSPDLSEPPAGRFVAPNYNALNAADADFGSGGVMLLPVKPGQNASAMAVAMGKDPMIYLLKRGLGEGGLLATERVKAVGQGFGVWGGPAYFAGPAGPTIFYQTDSDVLRAFTVSPTAASKLNLAAQGTSVGGFGGSLPIVSSNGSVPGTGIVWMIRRSMPLELEAYNAETLGAPIFADNIGNWSNPTGNAFLTPLAANGRVYAPGWNTVTVFGLVR